MNQDVTIPKKINHKEKQVHNVCWWASPVETIEESRRLQA